MLGVPLLTLAGQNSIARDEYLGSKLLLHYPSVDDIVNKLNELDLDHSFLKLTLVRLSPVEGGPWRYRSIRSYAYFIVQSVPFGYRHGSIFFEKLTDSIRYIMRKHGFNNLFNYVNDLIYCDLPSKIYEAYKFYWNCCLS